MVKPKRGYVENRKRNLGEIAGLKKCTLTKTKTYKRNTVHLTSNKLRSTAVIETSLKSTPVNTTIEHLEKFKKVPDLKLRKSQQLQKSEPKKVLTYLKSESSKDIYLKNSGRMACQVEMINGNVALDDRESSPDNESDIEIMTLKQTLKEKLLNESLNGSVNGNLETACGSSSSFNGNGTMENGHTEDKLNTDSEFENDVIAKTHTPKRVKGRFVKGKKTKNTTTPKQQTPVKKVLDIIEDESKTSDETWDSIELVSKDIEEETGTIDVVGDNEDSAPFVKEGDYSVQEQDVNAETEASTSVFSRLRESMRFSVSPQKQSQTNNNYNTLADENELTSFRAVSRRRPLHQTPPTYCFQGEHVAQKRKAESENPDAPQEKYFMNSLSERSPGWKFFSSPFSRFWSPTKSVANTTLPNSTPLRELHEDVDDSMTVNVSESLNISMQEDELDVEIDIEKVQDIDEKPGLEETSKPLDISWKCSIM